MGTKTKKQKVIICLSWLIVGLIAAAVFYLSNQRADESAALSQLFEIRIGRLLHIQISDFIVRKFAHATEFFVLACAVFAALYATLEKKKPAITLLVCFLYSVSDEIHQYFIPGRACRLFDVGVDSAGAALGILICMIFLFIKNHKKTKRISKTEQIKNRQIN